MDAIATCPKALASERGSSLVEVIVAAAILATGVLSMVQLFAVSAVSNISARNETMAMTMAAQKVEELHALDHDLDGTMGATLAQNVTGAVDHLDAMGVVVGLGTQMPPRAVYTRRWSIERIASEPNELFLVQVMVFVRGRATDSRNDVGYTRKAQVITVHSRFAE